MKKQTIFFASVLLGTSFLALISCGGGSTSTGNVTPSYPNVTAKFGSKISLTQLDNYANQTKPSYITKDNAAQAPITDAGATLGRVLFYDKQLSSTRTIACASCHQQALAFSDSALASTGVNGTTGRHSMRLINAKFADQIKFFWDTRAATLEIQTTTPIKDHAEMGFSGANGDLSFNDLLTRLNALPYYQELFTFVYGDSAVTEARIQNALSQFVRSIQSFDSKYDVGLAAAGGQLNANFGNFTAQENQGKSLFTAAPVFDANGRRTSGGLGCAGCHRAPEFDIAPNSKNNGIIGTISGGAGVIDILNTRSPTLRDLFNASGTEHGPMMHTGGLTTMQQVLGHYGGGINLAPGNTNLDAKLTPGGNPQRLQLTATEINAVTAFMKTLTGTAVYTSTKWSDPFTP